MSEGSKRGSRSHRSGRRRSHAERGADTSDRGWQVRETSGWVAFLTMRGGG